MQEVEINVIGLQLLQLLVEVTVEVVGGVDEPAEHLRGELDLLAVAIP